jgi:hypothetical protein
MVGMILSPVGGEVFSSPPDHEIGTDDLKLTSEQSQTLQDLKVQFHRSNEKKYLPNPIWGFIAADGFDGGEGRVQGLEAGEPQHRIKPCSEANQRCR